MIITSEQTRRKLAAAVSVFGKEFMRDSTPLTETERLYTLYHTPTAIKVDVWLEQETDFENKWKRKRMMTIQDNRIALVSPEDLILKKLSWCKEVWSDRHFRDCVGIWKVQKGKLDAQYLKKNAAKMGVLDVLEKINNSQYELM